jgi:hypothetical protein
MWMKTKIIWIVVIVIILSIGWYTLSPLLRNNDVQDTSPLVEESMETAKLIAQGDFVPKAHDVKGKALLIEEGDKKTVRFENFETINGPDVHIYLGSDLDAKDFVDLGEMKANSGNINYAIPAGVDTTKYNKVLVWCKAFKVLFSYAEIK